MLLCFVHDGGPLGFIEVESYGRARLFISLQIFSCSFCAAVKVWHLSYSIASTLQQNAVAQLPVARLLLRQPARKRVEFHLRSSSWDKPATRTGCRAVKVVCSSKWRSLAMAWSIQHSWQLSYRIIIMQGVPAVQAPSMALSHRQCPQPLPAVNSTSNSASNSASLTTSSNNCGSCGSRCCSIRSRLSRDSQS